MSNTTDTLEESKSTARVSIRIKSDSLDTADITRIVGVQPTRAVRKGEQPPDRSVPSLSGIWTYAVTSSDVSTAAADVLSTIEPVTKQLQDAAEKYSAEVTVSIFWQPEGGQGGYSMPADIVRRLSTLGERIDFYFS